MVLNVTDSDAESSLPAEFKGPALREKYEKFVASSDCKVCVAPVLPCSSRGAYTRSVSSAPSHLHRFSSRVGKRLPTLSQIMCVSTG